MTSHSLQFGTLVPANIKPLPYTLLSQGVKIIYILLQSSSFPCMISYVFTKKIIYRTCHWLSTEHDPGCLQKITPVIYKTLHLENDVMSPYTETNLEWKNQ